MGGGEPRMQAQGEREPVLGAQRSPRPSAEVGGSWTVGFNCLFK